MEKKEKGKILIPNFWCVGVDGDHALYESDLGWCQRDFDDAMSENPEKVFRYNVNEVGMSILFFWVKDMNWYTLDMEKYPVELRRLRKSPNWDGKWVYENVDCTYLDHHADGDVIMTFDDDSRIWNDLVINGEHIEQILNESLIHDIG